MKVAIIGSRGVRSTYGGIEKVLAELCPRIASLGHEIHVFGEDPGADAEPAPGVHARTSPFVPGKYTETITRSLTASLACAGRGFDVVNYVAVGPGLLAPLPRLARIPSVVSIHGLDWRRDKWPLPARLALQGAERVIAATASEITVVSLQLQDHFRKVHGREAVHTPNGLVVRKDPADPGALARLGLEPGGYVAFASRLVPEKGAHELIAAFDRIQTDKRLVIAGGGRYDQAYVEALRSADRRGRCVFTGHLTGADLDAVFQGAALYALPSHIEGLSLSLLEAMGFGKPVLVSDIPENLEVVGDCGFTFPVGDVAALADALAGLLSRPDDLAAMGRRAQERAARLYAWEAIARQYAELYERLGARGRARTPAPAGIRA